MLDASDKKEERTPYPSYGRIAPPIERFSSDQSLTYGNNLAWTVSHRTGNIR